MTGLTIWTSVIHRAAVIHLFEERTLYGRRPALHYVGMAAGERH